MTADERIDSLVSSFGQTISDLPKARDYSAYGDRDKLLNQMCSAGEAAESWYDPESPDDYEEAYTAYICHLCDVIDRMEAALETARQWMGCEMCGRSGSCQKVTDYEVDNGFIRDCDDFRIKDWFLEGV